MRIATAEIFSPVVTVTAFSSENEAVAIANGSNCGLLAGVYSRDSATASRVVGRDARFRLCTPARCAASRETGADLVFPRLAQADTFQWLIMWSALPPRPAGVAADSRARCRCRRGRGRNRDRAAGLWFRRR
ncbi:aldehyde dehydrogenase family protein [Streptomyces wuyuanensis]|uniref:aldehyde dehydrogenase family protein n=1 Tax=Streptomyces wuyuanensis TaxID=1196353 RepID=UPI0037AD711D